MQDYKHKCNKEVELAEMHKDLIYLKDTFEKEFIYLRKVLDGNGKEGFFDRVRALEKMQWKMIGVSATLIALSNIVLYFIVN